MRVAIVLLILLASACSTMRGKRIEARYARRLARSPQSMKLLRTSEAPTAAPQRAAEAPPPPPREIVPAPPPATHMAPFTPSPSPLLKRSRHMPLGSDRYCGGQACRDVGTSREWSQSL